MPKEEQVEGSGKGMISTSHIPLRCPSGLNLANGSAGRELRKSVGQG